MNGDAQQPTEPSGWQYKPGDSGSQTPANTIPPTPVPQQPVQQQQAPAATQTAAADVPLAPVQHPEANWTAPEFIARPKSLLWYLALSAITLALAVLIFFLSRDKVSTALILIIGIIAGISAGRKPRTMQYLLDSRGITINRAFRPYIEFKSFAILQEGDLDIIMFLPLKRFTLPLSLTIDPGETDMVAAKVSDYLPNDQTHGHDAFDRFIQRVHF